MNEIELAGEADRIEALGLGRSPLGASWYLFRPGQTTERERSLLELELRRRGLDIAVTEGTIYFDTVLEPSLPSGRSEFLVVDK